MKKIIFLWFLLGPCKAQSPQIVKFIFSDKCSEIEKNNVSFHLIPMHQTDYHNSIGKRKPEKSNLDPNSRALLPGKYTLKVFLSNKNFRESFEEEIIITKETQKIVVRIPKLKLRTSLLEKDKNDFKKYQNYYYCNELCHGKYVDYYEEHKKRIEGEFFHGKPLKLIFYGKNDRSKTISVYNGKWQPLQIKKYNPQGKLSESLVYTYQKRHIIVKKYDGNGKELEVTKYNRY